LVLWIEHYPILDSFTRLWLIWDVVHDKTAFTEEFVSTSTRNHNEWLLLNTKWAMYLLSWRVGYHKPKI